MIRGSNSCYPSGGPHDQGLPMYSDVVSSPSTSFLYNLSILKDKVHQVQSLAILFVSSDHSQPNSESTTGMAIASVETLIQEIIVTSSSMMFTCQQLALGNNIIKTTTEEFHPSRVKEFDADPQKDRLSRFEEEKGQGFYSNDQTIDHNWFADNDHSYITCNTSNQNEVGKRDQQISLDQRVVDSHGKVCSPNNYDIVELEAADLLAKYTHYCQVCGKGFKRDANLRMHMRAHGDEYKSSAALINPLKHINKNIGEGGQEIGLTKLPRKYSCPQEGCRWNKKHAKFQPLKSMICVKNHYRRSHCPKMYVCKRCNRKQFSVLSDLRTHEKHCGDLKWQCSCGTTFSRKDKLIGHVALFVGHSPAIGSLAKMGKPDKDAGQMQLER